MPPGAKKRKALKKKQQQQESTLTSTNGSNGDNHHENGDGRRESDDSSLSSPASSQGNGEFGGGTKDPSGLVKDTAKEITDHATQGLGTNNGDIAIALERGTDDKKKILDLASQDACEKSEHAVTSTSTHSNLVNKKSDEKKEYPSPEKDNGEVAAGTSRKVESARKSEAPVSPEENRLLLTGQPAVRTSWLSCCGLFDAVTGSDR
ncbi:hypothetical protein HA466_0252320 [Hirschfeldia incana]|nr:hypothetical protein HA466_0252320 [Hirschfeldia incana]KAJ0236948.1 hypothetical protein HA466_0252320 [Hirschfeldia incana]